MTKTQWLAALGLGLGLTLGGGDAAAQEVRVSGGESGWDAGRLAHALDRVAHTGRVLYVAAHPDDENTRLLAYLAGERHLTVAYLSLTRGEGGQNLLGTEKGELMGLLRTQELLAARRVDGARQLFTPLRDTGYSKSVDETLAQWGHAVALGDVVWAIRRFQPDVVLTRFNEKPPNHGQHTASAVLAREAVAAAADPKAYPEQLSAGVTPWRVERLLHNVSTWRDPPPPEALKLDVGGYDTRRGLSYGELAGLSRSHHKSQGFGAAGQRGPALEHFTHLAGSPVKADILEGVDVTWRRFGERAAPLIAALDEARRLLARDAPEAALPALARAHRALEALPEGPRRDDARAALEAVMAGAAGLFVRATAPTHAVAPGGTLPVKLELVLRRPAPLRLERVRFPGAPVQEEGAALAVHARRELARDVGVPRDAPVSALPRLAGGQGVEAVRDRAAVAAPEPPAPLQVEVDLSLEGRALTLHAPVQHVWTDPVHGERARRVLVTPPASVTPEREAVMLVNGRPGRVALRLRAGAPDVRGEVRLPVPAGWTVRPAAHPVALARAGDEATVAFEVAAPAGAAPAELAPQVTVGGATSGWREDVIDHPHVPVLTVLQPARVRAAPLALEVPRGLVGYVEGPGDTVREDLAHVGVRTEVVSPDALRGGDLSRFAAVVVGIRAFNARADVRAARARLMAYVEAGGTLVVQYNTRDAGTSGEGDLGPFPLTLGRERVTDEGAAVVAVDPRHPALRTPNVLGPADWQGWVQERGLYFAEKWDARYTPVLRMADPGEKSLEGSLLVARHGKGRYVYTGLAFFRQLPAGVPGAYRLFVNLLGGTP